jgi:cytochrome c553
MKPPLVTLGCSLTLLLMAVSVPVRAADAVEGIEFFEKRVRPVLAAHCYKCHSAEAKKVKGGLRLDSRAALLTGGDSGSALVPGKPAESRLVEAVGYKNVELQMPPKGKLPDAVIADLAAWVKMGAPWPGEASTSGPAKSAFDLARRKREHWAWQPLRAVQPPAVRDGAWPRDDVDRFLLARLEEKGLKPASMADRRTLIRRLSFDLVGLPPTPPEIEAFVRDRSPDAYEKVVDRLLTSPHFGERWGRHWLDLVRYGESRGHEFDYVAPNAYQYRDYVIRALNADVPYDQFVQEHVAGDLLPRPRLHPTEGFNESILGTGFWFLGEEVHSPVDIRQDEADRLDNMVDVLGKTFLGLTVACARCHDHKFDAISQKDYYSLAGFLESSNYRLARFDTMEQDRLLAAEIERVRERARGPVQRALAEQARPLGDRLAGYLLAAREAVRVGPEWDGEPAGGSSDVVFEDFESGTYDRWEVVGTAFGGKPQTLETIAPYQGKINAIGTYFVNSHNVRDGGDVARGDAHTGTMTSRPFALSRRYVTMLVGGGAHAGKTCVNLLVDGKVVLSATGRNDNRMDPVRWDVGAWRGRSARIQIVDDATGGWGNIGVDHIVLTDRGDRSERPVAGPRSFSLRYQRRLEQIATAHRLDPVLLGRWVAHLLGAAQDTADPLHAWAKTAGNAALLAADVAAARKRLEEAKAALAKAEVIVDYTHPAPAGWLADGVAFGSRPTRPGELFLGGDAEQPLVRFHEQGAAEKDALWDRQRPARGAENDPGALGALVRAGRTLCTPSFTVTAGKVYYLARGSGFTYAAVDSHRLIAGPLHGQLTRSVNVSRPTVGGDGRSVQARGRFQWVEYDLTPYRGQRAHLEFTARPGEDLAIALVVQAPSVPGNVERPSELLLHLLEGDGAKSPEALALGYQGLFRDTLRRLEEDRLIGSADAADRSRLANWLAAHLGLFNTDESAAVRRLAEAARPFVAEQARLAARIRPESRLAMALMDGSGHDERVFIRGSPKALGEPAPRRFLEALAGPERLPIARGSGRLELARQMTDPHVTPLLPRVLVNRAWHHLFGKGLVPSVDNFGVLGERPTHPELLDHLADRFVRDGWSIKKLIRALVLTSAYRMSSKQGGPGDAADPENQLLHRANLRRLEGEAIRDAMLAVSGRLSERMYGPSVAVHLTEFQEGRGRPASGPTDGDGRRSLYLAVRRNFLSPFLLAFDTPTPFSTVGRRTVSNVPAQALILMNDEFVHQQAREWGRRVQSGPGSEQEKIIGMYESAFARPPTEAELAACRQFLRRPAPDAVSAWADLAHVLFNVKEFIFLE